MMQPIQFKKNEKINLHLLKMQIDRRVDLIAMMAKGFKFPENVEHCNYNYCEKKEQYCQTEKIFQPLCQISNQSLADMQTTTDSQLTKSFQRSGAKISKQNDSFQSAPFKNKSKIGLKPIQQSDQQTIKTSRDFSKRQSNKKLKPISLNTLNSIKSQKQPNSNLTPSQSSLKIKKKTVIEQITQIPLSLLPQENSPEKTNIQYQTKKLPFEPENQDRMLILDFSFNSSIPDGSEIQSKGRKTSININDSFFGTYSQNRSRRPSQSYSIGKSSAFTTEEYFEQKGLKRIIISEDVKQIMSAEFLRRVQESKKRQVQEPRNNNIRDALLRRLEEKHLKTLEATE